ncbi:MAG: acetolactate synthase small subunit [Actinobacteria bacterium]|nr:acetolactate synthase small subunit [Actinomycetota bacterium]
MSVTTHTLSVLVANEPGVLARIAGLFSRRAFNIESLAVGPTEDPCLSRMTIVVSAEHKPIEQVTKQLHKLIHVVRIVELPHDNSVERELGLFKVAAPAGKRAEILEIAEIFKAQIVDVDTTTLVVESTGTPEQIASLGQLLVPYGILETARTGRVALGRGGKILRSPNPHPVPLEDLSRDYASDHHPAEPIPTRR